MHCEIRIKGDECRQITFCNFLVASWCSSHKCLVIFLPIPIYKRGEARKGGFSPNTTSGCQIS